MLLKMIIRNTVLLLLIGVLSLNNPNVKEYDHYANGDEDLPIHPIEIYDS